MEQKLVSFKVAKVLREAGYPQSFYGPQYKENGEPENGFTDLGEGCIYAPTYLDVWFWLWREKGIRIQVISKEEMIISKDNGISYKREDPEEDIIAAIEYTIDNNLLK